MDLIKIPYCTISKNSLTIDERATKEQWDQIGITLKTMEKSVQFWIGDWLRFGEKKWGEMYKEAEELTGLDDGTLRNYKSVASNVQLSSRNDNLPYKTHEAVASLEPAQQSTILDLAERDGLSVREVREKVKEIKRGDDAQKVIEFPKGKYQVIYADPPWPVESMVLDKWESPLDDKYKTMTIDEISKLDVPSLAADDCALFLWTTHTFLHEAFHIIEAWGFKYHACITWDKGNGWTLCGIHRKTEFCIYAYKGKMNIEQEGEAIPTAFHEAKGKHSQKPAFMRKEIERKIKGNKIELFARANNDGWAVWGNQL